MRKTKARVQHFRNNNNVKSGKTCIPSIKIKYSSMKKHVANIKTIKLYNYYELYEFAIQPRLILLPRYPTFERGKYYKIRF
jgi:hypothetical protein